MSSNHEQLCHACTQPQYENRFCPRAQFSRSISSLPQFSKTIQAVWLAFLWDFVAIELLAVMWRNCCLNSMKCWCHQQFSSAYHVSNAFRILSVTSANLPLNLMFSLRFSIGKTKKLMEFFQGKVDANFKIYSVFLLSVWIYLLPYPCWNPFTRFEFQFFNALFPSYFILK